MSIIFSLQFTRVKGDDPYLAFGEQIDGVFKVAGYHGKNPDFAYEDLVEMWLDSTQGMTREDVVTLLKRGSKKLGQIVGTPYTTKSNPAPHGAGIVVDLLQVAYNSNN